MKAVLCTRWGSPEVLKVAEVRRPEPRKREVRIRIIATTVTASDCIARGMRAPLRYRIVGKLLLGVRGPRRPIFGMVIAGVVDAVGRDVTNFNVGDQVFGMSRWRPGSYAEYGCWSAKTPLVAKPEHLTYDEAAALPYGGLLACHLMRKAAIQAGQRVLVYGASGAIGTATVQLARHLGARVTGVCSTRNLELVASLGAEAVLDYTAEDFTKRPERYDLIIDAVGRRKSAAALVHASEALGKL
jgi:NADPH:quinone reductase-like Zn-dependent oxidoreductase